MSSPAIVSFNVRNKLIEVLKLNKFSFGVRHYKVGRYVCRRFLLGPIEVRIQHGIGRIK